MDLLNKAAEAAKEVGAESQAQEGPPPSEGSQVSSMAGGDYVIHILIEQARTLILDGEDTVDPLIRVKILDVDKQTTAKKGITRQGKVLYNEHLFLEFQDIKQGIISNAQLILSVENKGFFIGDLIGQFTIPIQKIYNMDRHTMEHQILSMNNPDAKDPAKITANIAVSINVKGPSDEAIQLKMGTDKEVEAKLPMVPASIKKEYKQGYLRFFRAENLPKMDMDIPTGGLIELEPASIDAYVEVKIGACKLKTKVINQKNNLVEWYQEMLLPIEIPLKIEKITLTVWDEDPWPLPDDLCCSLYIPIKEIMRYGSEEKTHMKWVNLYGGPNGKSGVVFEHMNANAEDASEWKGRILVAYYCHDTKIAVSKIIDIPKNQFQKELDIALKKKKFKVICDVGSAIRLIKLEKYGLEICIGKESIKAPTPVQVSEGYCRWDSRVEFEFEESYCHMDEMADVFIYLLNEKGDRICYYRKNVKDCQEPEAKVEWLCFKPDFCVGLVEEAYLAGFISIKIYIHNVTDKGQFEQSKYKTWNKKVSLRNIAYKMRASIFQAQNLPPADSIGSCNPLVQIWTPDGTKIESQTCHDTNNPIFYEVKEFYIEAHDKDEAPPILLDFFDYSETLVSEVKKYLGRSIIYLKDIQDSSLSDSYSIPYPQWFPIKYDLYDNWDKECGPRVLVSFQLVDYSYDFKIKAIDVKLDEKQKLSNGKIFPKPDLKVKPFKSRITVLGLRGLVSAGLLPVRKAFVRFNLKSLLNPISSKAVDNIQTLPKESGSNPNIRTTLQFEVRLPQDKTFCPSMTCDTYDMLFFEGLPQPLIGTFTLKVGQSMFDLVDDDNAQFINFVKTKLVLKELLSHLSTMDRENRVRVPAILPDIIKKVELEMIDDDMEGLLEKLKDKIFKMTSTQSKRGSLKSKTTSKKTLTFDPFAIANKEVQLFSNRTKFKQFNSEETIESVQSETRMIDKNKSPEKPQLRSSTKKQLELEAIEKIQKKVEEENHQREVAQANIETSKQGFSMIINPIYKYNERLCVDVETDFPDSKLFEPVGYNENPQSGKKHYRRYYTLPLEKATDSHGNKFVESPFLAERITRATKRKTSLFSWFTRSNPLDRGPPMVIEEVGTFKGILKTFNEQEDQKRKERGKEALLSLNEDIQAVYIKELIEIGQLPDKAWNFDWNRLHPDKIETYEQMREAILEIRDLTEETGLGRMAIHQLFAKYLYADQLEKKLSNAIQCKARVYILNAFDLSQKDRFSPNDPYLIVKCGQLVNNERDSYQLDTAEPNFSKLFEYQVDLPGSPAIEIEVWDFDAFFGDSLIGITLIDLDDRFFSHAWSSLPVKPIESRDLYVETSRSSQGVIKLWCECMEVASKAAVVDPLDISGEPDKEFEVRIVIWKTKDLENMSWEGCSDAFFRLFFDPDNDSSTDTHWRCSDGKASFNWRVLLNVKNKRPNYNLTIQGWDRDVITSNTLIGEFQFELGPMYQDVYLTNRQFNLNKKYWNEYLKDALKQDGKNVDEIEFTEEEDDRFWFPIKRYDKEKEKEVCGGYCLATIYILPKYLAEKNPQGVGREAPNAEPFCPEPEGRIQLSINPFTMLAQLIPPALRRKIYCAICCLICLMLCVYMGPMIISNGISKLLFDSSGRSSSTNLNVIPKRNESNKTNATLSGDDFDYLSFGNLNLYDRTNVSNQIKSLNLTNSKNSTDSKNITKITNYNNQTNFN